MSPTFVNTSKVPASKFFIEIKGDLRPRDVPLRLSLDDAGPDANVGQLAHQASLDVLLASLNQLNQRSILVPVGKQI